MTVEDFVSASIGSIVEASNTGIRYQKQPDGDWLCVRSVPGGIKNIRFSSYDFSHQAYLFYLVDALALLSEIRE